MATYAAFKHVELYNVGSGKRRLVEIKISNDETSAKMPTALRAIIFNCIDVDNYSG